MKGKILCNILVIFSFLGSVAPAQIITDLPDPTVDYQAPPAPAPKQETAPVVTAPKPLPAPPSAPAPKPAPAPTPRESKVTQMPTQCNLPTWSQTFLCLKLVADASRNNDLLISIAICESLSSSKSSALCLERAFQGAVKGESRQQFAKTMCDLDTWADSALCFKKSLETSGSRDLVMASNICSAAASTKNLVICLSRALEASLKGQKLLKFSQSMCNLETWADSAFCLQKAAELSGSRDLMTSMNACSSALSFKSQSVCLSSAFDGVLAGTSLIKFANTMCNLESWSDSASCLAKSAELSGSRDLVMATKICTYVSLPKDMVTCLSAAFVGVINGKSLLQSTKSMCGDLGTWESSGACLAKACDLSSNTRFRSASAGCRNSGTYRELTQCYLSYLP